MHESRRVYLSVALMTIIVCMSTRGLCQTPVAPVAYFKASGSISWYTPWTGEPTVTFSSDSSQSSWSAQQEASGLFTCAGTFSSDRATVSENCVQEFIHSTDGGGSSGFYMRHGEGVTVQVYVRGAQGTQYGIDGSYTGSISAALTHSEPYNDWWPGSVYASWNGVSVAAYDGQSDSKNIAAAAPPWHVEGRTTAPTLDYAGQVYSLAYTIGVGSNLSTLHGSNRDFCSRSECQVATVIRASLPELRVRIVDATETFIASDTITVKAKVEYAGTGTPLSTADVPVYWTVTPRDAASGIPGWPEDAAITTDQNGECTLSFCPASNNTLFNDRKLNWTKGSKSDNPAISFDVRAEVGNSTDSVSISQDDKDRLRQEYWDYGQRPEYLSITIPERSQIGGSLGGSFNKGNYGVQVNNGLMEHWSAILSRYRSSTVLVNGKPVSIPRNASLQLDSAFRCPQRNMAIYVENGKTIMSVSNHMYGRALDITPVAVQIMNDGQFVRLNSYPYLWPVLLAAAQSQGRAFYDIGGTPMTLEEARSRGFKGLHVHVDW